MRAATCLVCGASFTYRTAGKPAVSCSWPCRQSRQREQASVRALRWARRIAAVAPFDPGALPNVAQDPSGKAGGIAEGAGQEPRPRAQGQHPDPARRPPPAATGGLRQTDSAPVEGRRCSR